MSFLPCLPRSNCDAAAITKIGAAQAQIQVMKDMEPILKQAKKANVMALLAMIVAGAAIASSFLLR